MSTRVFLIEILLRRYNAEHTKIISAFLFSYITHLLKEHFVRTFTVSYYIFKLLFQDYDVMTLEVTYLITFR